MADNNRLATRVLVTTGVFGRSTSVVVMCARLRIQEAGRCLLWRLLNEVLSRWSSENIPAEVFLHFVKLPFKYCFCSYLHLIFKHGLKFWNVFLLLRPITGFTTHKCCVVVCLVMSISDCLCQGGASRSRSRSQKQEDHINITKYTYSVIMQIVFHRLKGILVWIS